MNINKLAFLGVIMCGFLASSGVSFASPPPMPTFHVTVTNGMGFPIQLSVTDSFEVNADSINNAILNPGSSQGFDITQDMDEGTTESLKVTFIDATTHSPVVDWEYKMSAGVADGCLSPVPITVYPDYIGKVSTECTAGWSDNYKVNVGVYPYIKNVENK